LTALQWTSGTGFNCPTNFSSSAIAGTATNNNAAAGYVGEYVSSSIPSGSAVPLTSGTAANVTSVSLTAGDWECAGNAISNPSGATQTLMSAYLNTTSATAPTLPGGGGVVNWNSSSVSNIAIGLPPTRFLLSSTTTVYLAASVTFSGGTDGALGFLGCRRMR